MFGAGILFLLEKIGQHFGHRDWSNVAVCNAVDLNDRRKRATAQAGNFLDSEQALAIGILALIDFQLPFQCILNQSGTLHMTRGAMANLDNVPPNRPVPNRV